MAQGEEAEFEPGHRSPRVSVCLLVILGVATALGAYWGRQPVVAGWTPAGQPSDQDMHERMIQGVREGRSYYDACGSALREYGAATKPFFHWRLPTLLCGLALFPSLFLPRLILAFLGVIFAVKWTERLKPVVGFYPACLCMCLIGGSFVGLAFHRMWLLHQEVWAGILIGLSFLMHEKRPYVAVGLGVLALAIRELTLPFAVVMMLWALRERKKGEFAAWAAGIVGFGAFLAIHAWQVQSHLLPTDISDPSWIRFAGWPQAVACANWLFLGQAPHWLAGAVLVLVLFGLLYARQYRLLSVVFTYTAAFAIAGKPYNHYWGLMYSPLLAVGLAFAVESVRELGVGVLARPCATPK